MPIDGAAGLGYLMRRGFDLPPLMFTTEEVDAIALGVRLLRRLRDAKLQRAADNVLSKLTVVLPEPLRDALAAAPVYVSDGSAPQAPGIDLAAVREAIRARHKLDIAYVDEQGRRTRRKIWPIAIAYYVDVTLIAAWCELRSDYRHFRTDRIARSQILDEAFPADNGRLMAEWLSLRKERENPS